MKAINKYIMMPLTCLAAAAFTSCGDFLDLTPESKYTTGTFYTQESDFEYAISSVYAAQQDAVDGDYGYLHFLNARSDDSNSYNTNTYSDDGAIFADGSNNTALRNIWTYFYQMITRSNSILVRIDGVSFDSESDKNHIKGEAYALRGWAYGMLGRMFGGVPLIVDAEYTEAQTKTIARSTQEETFAQAVADLKKATDLLPDEWVGEDVGRVTRYAAWAELGRLYMFMNQPASALPCLQTVINSGKYALASTFGNCFTDRYDNTPSQDRVWEIQFVGGLTGEGQNISESSMMERYSGPYALNGASSAMQVSNDFLADVEDGDKRMDVQCANDCMIAGALSPYTWCDKFCHNDYMQQGSDDGSANIPIIRYTDVVLLYAEALNATSGPTTDAIGYVNAVRNRVGLPNLTSAQTDSKSSFLIAIQHERRMEFLFEGIRWFDQLRWNTWEADYKDFFSQSDEGNGIYVKNVQSFRSIFAIPQVEMDAYDNTAVMWQNPQY